MPPAVVIWMRSVLVRPGVNGITYTSGVAFCAAWKAIHLPLGEKRISSVRSMPVTTARS